MIATLVQHVCNLVGLKSLETNKSPLWVKYEFGYMAILISSS